MSSAIIKTLSEHEWIRVIGYRDVPGKPALYGTTKEFLDHFNLKTLDQLPILSELAILENDSNDSIASIASTAPTVSTEHLLENA